MSSNKKTTFANQRIAAGIILDDTTGQSYRANSIKNNKYRRANLSPGAYLTLDVLLDVIVNDGDEFAISPAWLSTQIPGNPEPNTIRKLYLKELIEQRFIVPCTDQEGNVIKNMVAIYSMPFEEDTVPLEEAKKTNHGAKMKRRRKEKQLEEKAVIGDMIVDLRAYDELQKMKNDPDSS